MPLISDMLPGFLGKGFWVSLQDAESLLIWILKMLNEKGPLPPLTPPRKIPESFPVKCWKTSRGFQPSRIHNRWKVTLAQDGRHFFQLLHKQVGKASPPLFGVSCAIHFWSYFVIDSCVSVSHNWLFNFFLTHSYPWSFLPAPACQVPPLKLSLEGSFFHKLSLHHWPLSPAAELHFFVPVLHSLGARPGVLQPWKQMVLINLPSTRFLAGHTSVTVGSCLTICHVQKQQ